MVIYKFTCGCGSSYVGRTTKRLRCRIKEHVPLSLEKALKDNAVPAGKLYNSAIAEHLIKNRSCGTSYNKDTFTIINTARSKLQLNILEALHIMHDRPVLCRQKQFVYGTLLFKSNGWYCVFYLAYHTIRRVSLASFLFLLWHAFFLVFCDYLPL